MDIDTVIMWTRNNVREIEQNRERMVNYLSGKGYTYCKQYSIELLLEYCAKERELEIKG